MRGFRSLILGHRVSRIVIRISFFWESSFKFFAQDEDVVTCSLSGRPDELYA